MSVQFSRLRRHCTHFQTYPYRKPSTNEFKCETAITKNKTYNYDYIRIWYKSLDPILKYLNFYDGAMVHVPISTDNSRSGIFRQAGDQFDSFCFLKIRLVNCYLNSWSRFWKKIQYCARVYASNLRILFIRKIKRNPKEWPKCAHIIFDIQSSQLILDVDCWTDETRYQKPHFWVQERYICKKSVYVFLSIL